MDFVLNKRNSKNLIYCDMLYLLKNKVNSRMYWKCVQSDCNVTMISENEDIIKHPIQHNHSNHLDRIEKLKCREQMFKKIEKSPNLSLKQIFNLVREKRTLELINNNKDIKIAPRFISMKSQLYSKRNSLLPPIDKKNITIPIDYQLTLDKKPFLIYNDSKMMIFSSEIFLQYLANSDRVYVDGTFSSAPKQFNQLFTFHVLVNENMFAVVFALLPDKKMTTYLKLISVITSTIRNKLGIIFRPEHLHCDFEMAIMQSFKTFFPNINIHGCYFHFTQCLLRKLQNLGLKKQYEKNNEIKLLIKRCLALPLISLTDLDEVWYLITSLNTIEDDEIDEFIYYIQSTWISNDSLFIREIWNHFGNFGTRTTNHLEGFHNKLNSCFNHGSPNLFTLIDQLKKFEFDYRIDLSHVLDGKIVHKKNKKYMRLNDNYVKYHTQYVNNQVNLLEYLDLVARLV
ncbi:uncharacterized protein LOC112538666 [Tetranychus urticae]|uniref:uncharacterized protein LOC112538666 n=1 Tax=Tetranychus urticae TaxID=32264 RepID=UPI000D64775E|nr:uncharacterized protein LOC112538666 [Tetranychus urticae]